MIANKYLFYICKRHLAIAKVLLLCTIISITNHCTAQDSITVLSGQILEDFIENNDQQAYDFYSLYDELKAYLNDPINLNKAGTEDLKALGMLNDLQIADILQHRELYGDFISPYELQSIPSLDIGTLNAVIPFVGVGSDIKGKNLGTLLNNAQHNIIGKYKRPLQQKKGYTDAATSPYLGNADYYYMRNNLTSGRNLRVGLTMEKDAGEEFFTGSNKQGFDYYTGFIYLRDLHPVFREISIGDYSISMGQGLIVSNSFSSGKSSYVMNVKRGGKVVKPYSSVNEFNLLRGVATTMQLSKKIDASVFASSKKIDGNGLSTDTLVDIGFSTVSSFVVNGLHRTENEISKKGTLTQNTAGAILKYKYSSRFKLGFNAMYNKFSAALNPRDDLYRKFSFQGDQLTNLSLDYSYRYENFNFFGEAARSDNGGTAHIHGMLVSLGRNVDASVLYRNYGRDYHVLNGNAFGEGSQPINERGVYFGLQFRPFRSITVSSYYDIWKNPWLKFNADAPTVGREFLLKIEYNKKRKFNLYAQYRYEQKGENGSGEVQGLDNIADRKQHRARINFNYTYSKELSLISRVEYNHYAKETKSSEGFLAFQDVKYKPIGKPYSFAMRYAIFDTEDTNSRIYMYENDVLYEFSIPFYSGSGTRFYIKSQYRITPSLYVQLRYARTYFDNVSDILLPDGSYVPLTIGSGNEATIGNVRSEVKFVVKYTIK